MKNRKVSFAIFFILVIAVGVAIIWGVRKASDKTDDFHFRPEILVSGISIEDDNDKILKVYPTIHIMNDLAIEARIKELHYELYHENHLVLRDLLKKNFTIRKQDTTQVTLPMKIEKHDLERLSDSFGRTSEDSARFLLKLFFQLDVPLRGYRNFDVEKNVDLPILRLLVVDSRKLSLEKFSLKHPELSMELKLRNPNSFPITIDDFRMTLSIGKDLNLHGTANGRQTIAAHGAETIDLDLKVDDMKIVKLAWKSLFKEDKTPFSSKLSFRAVSKNKMIDNCKFVILKDGMLAEIRK